MTDEEMLYDDVHIALLEDIWGEGFLSPGGPDEVAQVLEGLDLSGKTVLDIGCGCGHTSLSLAHRVGAQGAITGIDTSAPMLSLARTPAEHRAEPGAAIEFVEADAQTHAIQRDSFDAVFSRFGVMFFEDPVAAFSNIRTALRPNGRLGFCCWQPRAVNPFMTVPAQAALELLPPPPEMPPRAPGPFAFAEPDYIHSILSRSGFSDISITPLSRHDKFAVTEGNPIARCGCK